MSNHRGDWFEGFFEFLIVFADQNAGISTGLLAVLNVKDPNFY